MVDKEWCRTISKRVAPLDYRPMTHHTLFKLDRYFDYRYNALKCCEKVVDATLDYIFWLHHKQFLSSILNQVESLSANTKLRCTFVHTGRADISNYELVQHF
jgi:hypothetical protein